MQTPMLMCKSDTYLHARSSTMRRIFNYTVAAKCQEPNITLGCIALVFVGRAESTLDPRLQLHVAGTQLLRLARRLRMRNKHQVTIQPKCFCVNASLNLDNMLTNECT